MLRYSRRDGNVNRRKGEKRSKNSTEVEQTTNGALEVISIPKTANNIEKSENNGSKNWSKATK